MPTFTAYATLASKEAADALAEALEERVEPEPWGVGVFEIEDGSGLFEVGSYFEERPDETALAILAAAFGAGRGFVVSELPETDWVSHVRRELKPVEAGRFFVYGSHDAERLPAGRIGLLIEAAMAFGTGHHGTTLGCLRAVDRLAQEGFGPQRIADIGCGTAVLAMAAAHLWPGEPVLAGDIDPQAVEVAAANVRANGLEGRVLCLEAAGFDHPALRAARFDLVFANILKGPLVDLAPEMARALRPGGVAILSGILVTQADEVEQVYFRNGFNLRHREDIGDWSTIVLERNVSN
jgi:ribosomal protein L11 methyltransferase